MAGGWYDNEDKVARRTRSITIGKEHTLTFTIPYALRDSLPPAKGTNVKDIPVIGIAGIADIGATVKSTHLGQRRNEGDIELVVVIIEPEAYA